MKIIRECFNWVPNEYKYIRSFLENIVSERNDVNWISVKVIVMNELYFKDKIILYIIISLIIIINYCLKNQDWD